MDRPIDKDRVRARRVRRFGLPLLIGGMLVGAAMLITGWVRPTVKRTDLRIAAVRRGPVEATLSASGTVVPEYEHVVTSPIDSRVTRILKTPGDRLEGDEPIVELDLNTARLELDRLEDRIALKRIERREAKQDLARKVSELRGKSEIKALELKSLKFEERRCRENLETLFSRDDLRKAENDAERARIELAQVQEAIDFAETELETELARIDLELDILDKEKDEAAHRLRLSTAFSGRPGVLTWVPPSEGVAVRRGDELARIADLSAFRVEATISDVHGARVGPGLPATIRTGDTELRGRVANVLPTVEDGAIRMDIALDEKRHSVLRHNLRVEVYIVTDRMENALTVERGSFLNIDGERAVFVDRGDRAVRTIVEFGLANFECTQVLRGVAEGDRIIVSDMSHYAHVREVRIR